MIEVAHIQEKIKASLFDGIVKPQHNDAGHFYKYAPTGEVFASVTTKTSVLGSDNLSHWAAGQAIGYIEKHWDSITPQNRTEVLKAAQQAHRDTFLEAGDIGTRVHVIIEEYLNEWIATGVQPPDIRTFVKEDDVRLIAAVRSAELFCNDFHVSPVISEIKIASPRYKYGGTMDALMYVGKVIHGGTGSCKEHMWSETRKHIECYHCNRKLEMELTVVDWKTSNSIDKPTYAMQVSAYFYAFKELTKVNPQGLIIVRLDKERAKYEVVRIHDKRRAFLAFLNVCKVWDWLNNGTKKMYPVIQKEVIMLDIADSVSLITLGDVGKLVTVINDKGLKDRRFVIVSVDRRSVTIQDVESDKIIRCYPENLRFII